MLELLNKPKDSKIWLDSLSKPSIWKMVKTLPLTRETSFPLDSRTLLVTTEEPSGPLVPSSKIQSMESSMHHLGNIRRRSKVNSTISAWWLFKKWKLDVSKLLLMRNQKLSSTIFKHSVKKMKNNLKIWFIKYSKFHKILQNYKNYQIFNGNDITAPII